MHAHARQDGVDRGGLLIIIAFALRDGGCAAACQRSKRDLGDLGWQKDRPAHAYDIGAAARDKNIEELPWRKTENGESRLLAHEGRTHHDGGARCPRARHRFPLESSIAERAKPLRDADVHNRRRLRPRVRHAAGGEAGDTAEARPVVGVSTVIMGNSGHAANQREREAHRRFGTSVHRSACPRCFAKSSYDGAIARGNPPELRENLR